ncbi:M3 family oligoendopeptidase [Ktedonosporobacter rubrisoli]|uniref:M3 family oligoendopeptidase n=2 Tax=Ktedonosporobacter rubrisoli TaxID=2509675 RepID=A0A4P6K5U7_KTERU|nr:M3 family oligoendopeptidase [Ktedonosporobacter rubrisoli]
MTAVYPSLESAEFAEGFANVVKEINDLAQLLDTHHIGDKGPDVVDDSLIGIFEALIDRYNAVIDNTRTLSTYINCFITTDSQDTVAQARMSELQRSLVLLSTLGTRMTAWIGTLDVDALIARSKLASEHAYMLHKTKQQAEHLMSQDEESLAAELNVSSGRAWSKLHGDLTSQLLISLEVDGRVQELPMSVIRNLAYDTNRDVRRRAYEAELAGWKRAALPLAASLNSIKNEVSVLARRRRWESPLAASLFSSSIDQQTLDAMLTAARASFPDFRRYLQAKARVLGLSRLAWYDLVAPVGSSEKVWEFEDARNFIVEQFGSYSEKLSQFAARAFCQRWIDAEPRPGKRDGAFCASLRRDESRILSNFKPAFRGMSTLAHELGHGYHNTNLAQRTALQRSLPMTLAETASIFCETIVSQAALQRADRQEQIVILEESLQNSCQIVVDISSRFLFEQGVFAQRSKRELSIEELNELMLNAQRETYGDDLEQSLLHPYMWAVKGHYYSTGRSFYNYPYMFGLLFGLGLYAHYQRDPESFKRGYDDLLSSTGMADAATLAARFGIDLRSEAFWNASLDIVRGDIERFEQLIAG